MQEKIQVSKALEQDPRVGPCPVNLVCPLLVAAFVGFFIGYRLFQWRLLHSTLLGVWVFVTWWVVTGGRSWNFIRTFARFVMPHWHRSPLPYRSLHTLHDSQKPSQRRTR